MMRSSPVYRWLTSVLSSMAGALLGMVTGFFLGGWYAQRFMPPVGGEAVILSILGGGSGVIIGSLVGAVSSAQARRFRSAWVVSLLLALVVLALVVLLDWLSWNDRLTVLVFAGAIGHLVERGRHARAGT